MAIVQSGCQNPFQAAGILSLRQLGKSRSDRTHGQRSPRGVRLLSADCEGKLTVSEQSRYYVCVTRRGPPTAPFGWEISPDGASAPIERPARTFPTRVEALLDSVRVVASLELVPLIDTTTDYLN
jgi:hypothetical protein